MLNKQQLKMIKMFSQVDELEVQELQLLIDRCHKVQMAKEGKGIVAPLPRYSEDLRAPESYNLFIKNPPLV